MSYSWEYSNTDDKSNKSFDSKNVYFKVPDGTYYGMNLENLGKYPNCFFYISANTSLLDGSIIIDGIKFINTSIKSSVVKKCCHFINTGSWEPVMALNIDMFKNYDEQIENMFVKNPGFAKDYFTISDFIGLECDDLIKINYYYIPCDYDGDEQDEFIIQNDTMNDSLDPGRYEDDLDEFDSGRYDDDDLDEFSQEHSSIDYE